MAKDYYFILGLDADASQDEIKSAYRRQVKKYHPDHYGKDREPFLEVQEAYETLSDPSRREDYDTRLARDRRAQQNAPRGVRSEPLGRTQTGAKPFRGHHDFAGIGDLLFDWSFRNRSSSFEEIFDRLWSDFTGMGYARKQAAENVGVEITLTRSQARHGGRVRIWIPAEIECPTCRGSGGTGFFECSRCWGTGVTREEIPIWVAFPRGISDHHTIRIPLDRLGFENLCLTVHFHITD